MQPLESGIFEALKSKYWRKTDNLALYSTENNSDLMYGVDQLAAMK